MVATAVGASRRILAAQKSSECCEGRSRTGRVIVMVCLVGERRGVAGGRGRGDPACRWVATTPTATP